MDAIRSRRRGIRRGSVVLEAAPDRSRRFKPRRPSLRATGVAEARCERVRRNGAPHAFACASRLIFFFVEWLARRFERQWKARAHRLASNARRPAPRALGSQRMSARADERRNGHAIAAALPGPRGVGGPYAILMALPSNRDRSLTELHRKRLSVAIRLGASRRRRKRAVTVCGADGVRRGEP